MWSAAIMGLGLLSAVTTDGRHWFAVRNWLIASFRTAVVTERAVRRAGPALTRQMPAGEVVTSFASDFWRIGNAYDVIARIAGAIVSFVVVSAILLHGSVRARRDHARRRPAAARLADPRHAPAAAPPGGPARRRPGCSPRSAPTPSPACACCAASAARTPSCPATPRSPGGCATRGVRLSGIQATLDAAQVLLPGIFVVLVTGVGRAPRRRRRDHPRPARGLLRLHGVPHHAAAHRHRVRRQADPRPGRRPPGRARSSASSPTTRRTATGATLNGHVVDRAAPLVDPVTGVVIEPGRVTALVSARPEETSELAHRLGRTRPGRARRALGCGRRSTTCRWMPCARASWCPRPTRTCSAGRCARRSGGGERRRTRARAPCGSPAPPTPSRRSSTGWTASSRSAAGPSPAASASGSPWPGRCCATPRCSCSSSRRARSTPTPRPGSPSGWSAHRAGRTTVVVTASPLLLDRADVVVLVEDGRVAATRHGTTTCCARTRPTATSCCGVRS